MSILKEKRKEKKKDRFSVPLYSAVVSRQTKKYQSEEYLSANSERQTYAKNI